MNRWVLLALVVLVVGVFALGQGRALTRDEVVELPEEAPGWIGGGLGGLLRPFAAELDPADVQAQSGVGWAYEPASGRLRLAAGTLASSVELRLPAVPPEDLPEPGAKPHERSRRMIELVEVTSAESGAGKVSVRLVDPLDADASKFAELKGGRMQLAVPPEGARLELSCVGARSFLLR
jgi:hypothetical protein